MKKIRIRSLAVLLLAVVILLINDILISFNYLDFIYLIFMSFCLIKYLRLKAWNWAFFFSIILSGDFMFDTHCHLFKEYYDDPKAATLDMDYVVVSSDCPAEFYEVLNLIKLPNVYGTLGIQPEFCEKYSSSDLLLLENLISNKKIVGIGEIGLDYHYDMDKFKQKELFIYQIKLANKYKLPIVVHSRDALEDTVYIIKKYKDPNIRCDLHCYSYGEDVAKEFVKHNIYLGIGGILTFKNEVILKNVVRNISLDYLLLETDSPYLSPVPLRGKKNLPHNIYYVARAISEIKNVSVDEVLNKTLANGKNFFNILW